MAAPNIIALDRLKSQLLTSGLQERNNALYQVINQLIDFLRQSIDLTASQISALTPPSSGVSGGTIITGGMPMANNEGFNEGILEPMMIPGPVGQQGIQGQMGPPGLDGVCDECSCMPFIATTLYP